MVGGFGLVEAPDAVILGALKVICGNSVRPFPVLPVFCAVLLANDLSCDHDGIAVVWLVREYLVLGLVVGADMSQGLGVARGAIGPRLAPTRSPRLLRCRRKILFAAAAVEVYRDALCSRVIAIVCFGVAFRGRKSQRTVESWDLLGDLAKRRDARADDQSAKFGYGPDQGIGEFVYKLSFRD